MSQRQPGEVGRRKRLVRALTPLLVALCVLVFSGIPGVPVHPLALPEVTAPPLPPEIEGRDASLAVVVKSGASHGPVAGVRVRAYAIVDGRAFLAGQASTDALGNALLSQLPRGEHWVIADAPGFARASSHVLLTPDARSLEMELGEEHHVEVAVRDERGNAVDGVEIEVTGAEPLPYGGRTGEGGIASIGRLGPAPWRVSARAPGYEEVIQRGVHEGEKIVLTLRRLGALVVKVLGWDDAFVAGAHVQIAGASLWPARVTETDAKGTARIGGLSAGTYALRAVYGQDCSPIELGVSLERGEEKTVTLHLAPGRMVLVRVTDGDAQDADVVAGARISLVEAGLSPFPMEARTGKDGRAKLGPISLGSAFLAARAEGYVPRGAIEVPEPPPHEMPIPLVKAGTLTGRVVDARGFPVDGATIEIIGTDFNGGPIEDDPRRSSFRDSHFEAMLRGPTKLLNAGELGVMPGPVPPIPHAFGGGDRQASAVRTLPDPGAAVVTPDEPWVTRNDGTFKAKPASPGHIRALVRHPQYVEALSDIVTLSSGGEANVDVVMYAGGHLEGRVVDSRDRPVDNVRVQIAATRGSYERSTRVATDGTFLFSSVPDAVVASVVFEDDPTQILTRMRVDIPEGKKKEITITLPESRPPLPVTAKDDRDFPLPNVQLTAHSLDPGIPFRSTVFSNANGDAQIPNAKGLLLRIEAIAPSRAPKVVKVDPTAKEIAIVLGPAESARGEVRGARTGEGIAGAEIVYYTELGAHRTRTGADGSFKIDGLAPGPLKLRVRGKGYAPVAKDLTIPAQRGDRPYSVDRIELSGEGIVEGTVVDGRGDPIQGARVAKDSVPTYLAAGSTPPGVAVTDAKGRFSLGELAEGTVTLEAFAPDLGRARAEGVRISAGRTTINVRIILEKGEAASGHEPAATGGVAVTLGETGDHEVVIVAVAEGSEAEHATLAPNDVLVEVDGAKVSTIEEARKKLSGPIGDDVLVKYKRGDKTDLVRIAREQVRR